MARKTQLTTVAVTAKMLTTSQRLEGCGRPQQGGLLLQQLLLQQLLKKRKPQRPQLQPPVQRRPQLQRLRPQWRRPQQRLLQRPLLQVAEARQKCSTFSIRSWIIQTWV